MLEVSRRKLRLHLPVILVYLYSSLYCLYHFGLYLSLHFYCCPLLHYLLLLLLRIFHS